MTRSSLPAQSAFRTGVLVTAILLCTSCSETVDPPSAEPPYALGPVPQRPIVFSENVVSTTAPEFASSFTPDGREFYFNRASADRSTIRIFRAEFADGDWREPAPLPFSDGRFRDLDPFVTPDGSRLYFSSDRGPDGNGTGDFDTWYSERNGSEWGRPRNPGAPLNSDADEIYVSATSSGTIYFSRFEGGSGRIYRSEMQDGMYETPLRLDLGLPDSVGVGNPMIAPDESYLLFTSDRMLDSRGADIYFVTRTVEGTWGPVRGAGGEVNSEFADFAPCISPDGRYLFFTSERPGVAPALENGRPPGDIYRVLLAAATQ